MSKVCRSRRSRVTSLTPTPPLAALLEGNVGFCFVLLVFLGCFFSPFTVSNPRRCFVICGKTPPCLQVGEVGQGLSQAGAAFGVKSLCQGLNPLYLGLTQGLKPHL